MILYLDVLPMVWRSAVSALGPLDRGLEELIAGVCVWLLACVNGKIVARLFSFSTRFDRGTTLCPSVHLDKCGFLCLLLLHLCRENHQALERATSRSLFFEK